MQEAVHNHNEKVFGHCINFASSKVWQLLIPASNLDFNEKKLLFLELLPERC